MLQSLPPDIHISDARLRRSWKILFRWLAEEGVRIPQLTTATGSDPHLRDSLMRLARWVDGAQRCDRDTAQLSAAFCAWLMTFADGIAVDVLSHDETAARAYQAVIHGSAERLR